MVEIAMAPYDDSNIPLVNASIVDIDAELSDDSQSIPLASVTVLPTASVIPDRAMSDITSDPLHPIHLQHPCHCPEPSDDSSFAPHQDHSLSSQPSSHSVGDGEEPHKEIAFGAGVGGAIFGMVLGGPLFSMIFGVSAAYYTKQQGPGGNLARAVGDVTLLARDKWREHQEQCRENHREHHRITCGARQARKEARKMFLQGVVKVWKAVMEYVEENKLIERGSEHLKKIIDQVASHLLEQQKQKQQHEQDQHRQPRGPDPATQKI
eukprot:Nitzschia sp. Nitz4//scaffold399_size11037//6620//7414//NITZ4_009053-RA/size11037-processed-gene-0.5-mRNA-1//-1//CDS//3329550328//7949//frame0